MANVRERGMNCSRKRGKCLYFWLEWEFESRIAETLSSHGDVFQAERQPRHRPDLSRYLTSLGAGRLRYLPDPAF